MDNGAAGREPGQFQLDRRPRGGGHGLLHRVEQRVTPLEAQRPALGVPSGQPESQLLVEMGVRLVLPGCGESACAVIGLDRVVVTVLGASCVPRPSWGGRLGEATGRGAWFGFLGIRIHITQSGCFCVR
jgi:hypothetical protein